MIDLSLVSIKELNEEITKRTENCVIIYEYIKEGNRRECRITTHTKTNLVHLIGFCQIAQRHIEQKFYIANANDKMNGVQ